MKGEVDERPIEEVQPEDLKGYTQHHFFAGIAGWSLALQLAGWPEEEPVWTGSCPCQPFSGAGRRQGENDPRHLWPAFFRLISKCKPATVFGEQVGGSLGREWVSAVRLDLEQEDYAAGIADLPAAGCGAPHGRQRLFFVADSTGDRLHRSRLLRDQHGKEGKRGTQAVWCKDRESTENGQENKTTLGEWLPKPEPVPEANGIPGQLEQLCSYGNAIVPQVASMFINAFIMVKMEGEV